MLKIEIFPKDPSELAKWMEDFDIYSKIVIMVTYSIYVFLTIDIIASLFGFIKMDPRTLHQLVHDDIFVFIFLVSFWLARILIQENIKPQKI